MAARGPIAMDNGRPTVTLTVARAAEARGNVYAQRANTPPGSAGRFGAPARPDRVRALVAPQHAALIGSAINSGLIPPGQYQAQGARHAPFPSSALPGVISPPQPMPPPFRDTSGDVRHVRRRMERSA